MYFRRLAVLVSLMVMVTMVFFACGPSLPGSDKKVEYDVPPENISMPPPTYSDRAKDAGIEGMVLLHMLIDSKGDVREVRLLKGIDEELDAQAMASARESKWEPAKNKNNPVACWISMPIRFKLRKDNEPLTPPPGRR